MTQIEIIFLLLGIAAILLIRNILRPDIVALLLMLGLEYSGILTPQESLLGFSRPAIFIMMSAFILAEGLRRSGATERLGEFIVRMFGKGERRLTFGVMTAAAFLSLFMNNIAAASLLFPVISGVARRTKISSSQLLMPLAFGTILGGMATLLTTTNIIVSGLLRGVNLTGFGLLDFAPVGLPLAFLGILFVTLWGRTLLPQQSPAQRIWQEEDQSGEALLNTYQLNERFLRAAVRPGKGLDGKKLAESDLREKYHLNIMAVHHGKNWVPPDPNTSLLGGDILLILARPEDSLPAVLNEFLEILPAGKWQQDYLSIPNFMLIETAIAPRSHLAGQSLQELQFQQKFGSRVLAIWRQGRSIRTRLADLQLEFGDGLLLQGPANSLELLRTEPGLILLAESAPIPRMSFRGWLAVLIMIITLGFAVIFPAQLAEIMLSGAIGMVLIGMLTMDQAYRAIDWRSLFMVAGMLPVGIAMDKTGAAALLAQWLISNIGVAGQLAVLAGLVLLTVLLTQVINGAAAVTVVAPIAISTSLKIGMDPRSAAMAIAIASSMAFMSPLGHSVNIMVMGAGGYKFRDYARIGVPLTIILFIALLILLPIIMPLI
ncbi:MAG: SLC13 family permease [Chloroflexota bacterium]